MNIYVFIGSDNMYWVVTVCTLLHSHSKSAPRALRQMHSHSNGALEQTNALTLKWHTRALRQIKCRCVCVEPPWSDSSAWPGAPRALRQMHSHSNGAREHLDKCTHTQVAHESTQTNQVSLCLCRTAME